MRWFLRWQIMHSLTREAEQQTVGKFGREAAPFLQKVLQDSHEDSKLRRKAIKGLALLADKSDLEVFTRASTDADPEIRIVSVQALQGVWGNKAVGMIASHLHDKNKPVAAEAAAALVRIGSQEAMQALILSIPTSGLVGETALLQAGVSVIPFLLESLLDETCPLTRRAISAHLLEKLKWIPATDEEKEAYRLAMASYVVQNAADEGQVCEAIDVLAHFISLPNVREQLLACLSSKATRVQLAVLRVIARVSRESDLDTLILRFKAADTSGIRLAVLIAIRQILGDSPDPRLQGLLVQGLTDDNADVEEVALDLLQSACPPEERQGVVNETVERVLEIALTKKKDVRGRGLELLDRIDRDWGRSMPMQTYLPNLVEALQHGGEGNYILGIESLLRRAGPPAVEAILRLPSLGTECLGILAEIPDPRSFPALIIALTSGREFFWTAVGLGKIGDRRAVQPLIAVMNRFLDEFSRGGKPYYFSEIAKALGRLRDPQAIPVLQHALALGVCDSTAAMALATLGDLQGWQALEKLIQEDKIFFQDLQDLAGIDDPRTVELLKRALHSEKGLTRWTAAECFLKILKQDAVAWVTPLLEDKEEIVRQKVSENLAEVGGEMATSVLKQALAKGMLNAAWILPHFVSQKNYRAADLLIQGIFAFPRKHFALKKLIGEDYFGDYHALILQAASYWVFDLTSLDGKHRVGDFIHDLDEAFEAISRLEAMGTPISVNLLHEITRIKDVKVLFSYGCFADTKGDLDFSAVRQAARAALQRCSDPPFHPELYLEGENWKR